MNDTMTLADRADALEHRMMRELDTIIVKSRLFNLADADISIPNGPALLAANPGKHMLMGDDPRLPKMPEDPTLMDFFKYRFSPSQNHLLQSAKLPLKNGHGREDRPRLPAARHRRRRLHPRATMATGARSWSRRTSTRRSAWAIRGHQALRFYPDQSVGYAYPEMYIKHFGADYKVRAVHRSGVQEGPQPQVVHDQPADHRSTTSTRSTRTSWSTSKSSSTSSAATSGSPKRGSALTAARRRTCGAP